ncbi:MAG: efflux RND transporter periplasmic adaptor subunit [Paramuribaculum sp.]|nr:efflux RND transporter periplasmic adaptor subunit [Paramuribaculum sp.]MDE6488085.1 efflux RND transporter periplasmic adaptor subunit [Paramuribaculum sp.]
MITTLLRVMLAAAIVLPVAGCEKKSAVKLETVEAEKGDLSETVTATGTLESATSVDVGTQVTGIIDKLYADFNSIVTKGQLIAEIEKTILESDLRSAQASVESAKVTYDYTLTNYNRDKALHAKQLISDYEFETSRKDYEVAKAAYEKAQADKVRAAKNLNYAEIYSPIDGIVISREVEVGQTVVSSMNVANLYTIADLDNMQVVANVDEADIGQVKVGQHVTFSVDAYPDIIFEGSVTQVRLSPTTESNVVTYEVIVATSNPDHKLIPGLTANITIYVMEEKDAMLLPVAAFSFTPEDAPEGAGLPVPGKPLDQSKIAANEKTLWVVEGDKLVQKAVVVGESNGMKTQVLGGLPAGAKVAVGYDDSAVVSDKAPSGQTSPFAPKRPGKK